MAQLVLAEGPILEQVLDTVCASTHPSLSRTACGRLHAAQGKTAWGRSARRHWALVNGGQILAGVAQYDLAGVLDGTPTPICGIGPVATVHGGRHARTLIDRLIERAAQEGAEFAVLFPQPATDDRLSTDFETLPLTDVTLDVAKPTRYGAPMTMVRGGEERDLAAIVKMGRARAEPFRFHLDRSVDFIQYAITTKRLLAGLGTAAARQLHFFIAEEGTTAAAYVVVTVADNVWTLEECGDRDPSGARVGALLQALIAREPVERRPIIRAWLPPGFLPQQVTISSATPATDSLRVRPLGSRRISPYLDASDLLYWRNDLF